MIQLITPSVWSANVCRRTNTTLLGPTRLPVTSAHSWLTHHCHCVAGQDGAHVQHGVVGHVGEDVDDGDDGHGNGDGQWKVSETTFIADL